MNYPNFIKIFLAKNLLMLGMFGVLLSGIYYLTQDIEADQSASILIQEDFMNQVADSLGLKNAQELHEVQGVKAFFDEIAKIDLFFDLYVEEVPNGKLISFSGKSKGKSLLHPYFGFLEIQSDQTILHWSKQSKGLIMVSNVNEIYLKNISNISWNIADHWENYANGEQIFLKSTRGKIFIEPGETGIFKLINGSLDDLMPLNVKHNYLIEVY